MGKQESIRNPQGLQFSNGVTKCNHDSCNLKTRNPESRRKPQGLDVCSGYSAIRRNDLVGSFLTWMKTTLVFREKKGSTQDGISQGAKNQTSFGRHAVKRLICLAVSVSFFLVVDYSILYSAIHRWSHRRDLCNNEKNELQCRPIGHGSDHNSSTIIMHKRLLNLAANALSENDHRPEKLKLQGEPLKEAAAWKPCADRENYPKTGRTTRTGFIMVTANGGLNQQRVAVCNAVAVASLLNATLVVPRFMYSTVWKDKSQFSEIYQEEYFIHFLEEDVSVVKELPLRLQQLDIEAIGSLLTDNDIEKESKPSHFVEKVLPLLLKNEVVHFLGFGNRLGFDPLPLKLQRLRCKCNFHALKFVSKIQMAGSLLLRRIRHYESKWISPLDEHLLGASLPTTKPEKRSLEKPWKYLAVHLRFEIDMLAYTQCEFGGGGEERKELQSYRETHFPTLVMQTKNIEKPVSPTILRKLGRCPLTPEEVALLLSALGFPRNTHIYLAGAPIYGGKARMASLTSLYPNVVSKEDLLTPPEIEPFRNFSSQLAALDFIVCAAADVFAITDSGSQLSSLVSGYRTYYGEGKMPILRPNKKRYAKILSEDGSLRWSTFEERVRKMIRENQRVAARPYGRSIYRHPRSPECMCKV